MGSTDWHSTGQTVLNVFPKQVYNMQTISWKQVVSHMTMSIMKK